MSEKWFGPKPNGYGAVPIHWKGWATMAAYVVVTLLGAIWSVIGGYPVFAFVVLAAWTVLFLIIVRLKGPKSWKSDSDSE